MGCVCITLLSKLTPHLPHVSLMCINKRRHDYMYNRPLSLVSSSTCRPCSPVTCWTSSGGEIAFFPLDKMTYLTSQSFVNRVEESLSLIECSAFLYNVQLIWYSWGKQIVCRMCGGGLLYFGLKHLPTCRNQI